MWTGVNSELERPVSGAAASPVEAPRLVTLENGLEIIIQVDRSAPVAAVQAWCRAGSIHEGTHLGAGLSHVLEHMLFKGTESRSGARIDQEVQEAGGYMNAYTSFDHTVYLINVPNTGLSVAVDILCDIMRHATLPEDELQKEKEVILREMDMLQDDPSRRSSRRLFETAFRRSPYRYPIIGLPDIYRGVQRHDVVDYYRRKYCPNNCFFVITGDVDPDAVVEQIRQAYDGVPAASIPPDAFPVEPRQTSSREVIEEAPIQLGHLHWAWHVPELQHPDIPVLDVLSTILGGGRSSRLYQRVRETERLVHSIDGWVYTPGNPGLFGVSAVLDAARFSATRAAVENEIARLREESPTAEELAKAIKQLTAATFAARKTMYGLAQDLGHNWLSASDLHFSQHYLEQIQKVDLADLQRVARHYLNPNQRTLFALLPDATAPRPAAPAVLGGGRPIQCNRLDNGMRVLMKPDARLPFVQYRAVFQGGVLAETANTSGLTALMSRLMIKGTAKYSARQIAETIESLGGSIDTYTGNNSFGLSLETLQEDLSTGLELLAETIRNPAFPEAELEREREVLLASIKAQQDQLLSRTARLMRRGLYGDEGFGLHHLGTPESVASLQISHLADMHRTRMVPENCVLAVFGNFEPEVALRELSAQFSGWGAGAHSLSLPRQPDVPTQSNRLVESTHKKQAVIVVGFPGTTIHDNEHRYALDLIQEACNDLGSRLFLRIRDELGLAYYVGTQNVLGMIPGYFAFYAGTAPGQAQRVEEEIFREAAHLAEFGLTPQELDRAKAKLLGQRKISRQDLGSLASTVALDELYGLGFQNNEHEDQRYEAVTGDQIRLTAQKIFNRDHSAVAIVHPDA